MGWFQRQRGAVQPRDEPQPPPPKEIAVGARDDGQSKMTYNDKSITFTGDLASYDYDSILRDKQRYVNSPLPAAPSPRKRTEVMQNEFH